jgi:hypothetical protein
MLNISRPQLVLLVSALNDAIKFNEGFLRSETIRDVSDHEEHLQCLENFQAWLEQEYKRLEKQHPDLIKYDDIVRR